MANVDGWRTRAQPQGLECIDFTRSGPAGQAREGRGPRLATGPAGAVPQPRFAVRRTRPFVKRYYPNDRIVIDGIEVPITFPRPRPISVPYDLDEN